jgi:serine/tyrosine/threonine adenylyltransferase
MSTNGTNGHQSYPGVSLSDLPKSHVFTTHLPPDPIIPTPESSKTALHQKLRISRLVNSVLFTWVAPEMNENLQLLATSRNTLKDLGLNHTEAESKKFLDVVSGNKNYEEHYLSLGYRPS